ncbi:MAG: glycosyl transferase [Cyanomargarita calcarea GSE-NOS-MK-12-04C]|jgi:predicted glycosyltransferase|uniref:Glycosyl transferase n=1 Tax=Cyanomargarita calcarea GSE-NOS-MK-12-04C TaxID=2839659 RepID=A0A951QKS8_9CYAN|nr:glycosyl transferase [Cyanomargarita calcarea GSE-NOS-MK-12-04C]
MKKIMFYCQYLSGMGHLVRSSEIVRSLVKDFQVYFINGGPKIEGFEMPPEVELIRLPALWLEDGKFTVGDGALSVEEVKEIRKNQLISEFDRIQPDCLITEFFPFGRHKLLFELIPLVEHIKSTSPTTKIACSLRDVIGKESDPEEEDSICYLMNRYFDLLLFHSDPNFQTFTESFSRHQDIKSIVTHTGFVTRSPIIDEANIQKLWGKENPEDTKILVSVGGGRIGHELLETVVEASSILDKEIPHIIKIFTGPFMPESKVIKLKKAALNRSNIEIETFTSNLIAYMKTADISVSLSGYNTTMNILSTGVRALVVPIGHENQDKEQLIRTTKLEKLGIVDFIHPQDLNSANLAEKIINCLNKKSIGVNKFDLKGAENTTNFLKDFLHQQNESRETGITYKSLFLTHNS